MSPGTDIAFPGPADLPRVITALSRFLVVRSPFVAEGLWAFAHGPGKHLPLDEWVAVQGYGKTYWTMIGSDGKGRTSSTQPREVIPGQSLTVPITNGPSFVLRDLLDALVSKMSDARLAQPLRMKAALYREMGNGIFEDREVRQFLETCFSLCDPLALATPPDKPIKDFLSNHMSQLSQRHSDYAVPGYYVGLMKLLEESWKGAEFFYLTPGPIRSQIEAIAQTRACELKDFLKILFQHLVNQGDIIAIEYAAKTLHGKATELLKKATGLDSMESFNQANYLILPYLSGAYEGFRYVQECTFNGSTQAVPYVTKSGIGSLADAKRKECAGLRHVCDEQMTTIYTSLHNAFEDAFPLNRKLNAYATHAKSLLDQKGKVAAEDYVDQLIYLLRFYPECCKKTLLPVP